MSVGSEFNHPSMGLVVDDNSNDAPLVVDDAHTSFPPCKSKFYFSLKTFILFKFYIWLDYHLPDTGF